jgi:hypothetical protein
MAELVTLNAPVQADPGATVFRIALIVFDWEHAVIKVHLKEWGGSPGGFVPGGKALPTGYEGPVATTLMRQLNTINLTTQSLHQRIMARLLADGKIPSGTSSGAPD